MGKNANLHKAKVTKNDEFYTRYEDIDKEIQHYRDKLKGLIVYCPAENAEKYKKQDKTWRIQNPYLLNGENAKVVYQRIFIRKRTA